MIIASVALLLTLAKYPDYWLRVKSLGDNYSRNGLPSMSRSMSA
jgi:hypothetical protein